MYRSNVPRNAAQRTPRRVSRSAGHKRPGRKPLSWKQRLAIAAVTAVLFLPIWAVMARSLAPTSNTSLTRFDTIVVLGTPADSDGNPTPEQLARVTEAVHEYKRGVASRLILTGGATRYGFVEARGDRRDCSSTAEGGAHLQRTSPGMDSTHRSAPFACIPGLRRRTHSRRSPEDCKIPDLGALGRPLRAITQSVPALSSGRQIVPAALSPVGAV